MAWLNTAPKPDKPSLEKAEAQPRLLSMKANGIVPSMPPNPLPHIVEWLLEIGPTVLAGMGSGPITWGEIKSWSDLTKTQVQSWEARLLRRLSKDFLSARHDAEKEGCPAPWIAEESTESNREAVSRKIGMEFRAMMAAQKGVEVSLT